MTSGAVATNPSGCVCVLEVPDLLTPQIGDLAPKRVGRCAAGSFPTFDALRTLTGGIPDRDEGHGPLRTFGCHHDEAQGDINLSRSPL